MDQLSVGGSGTTGTCPKCGTTWPSTGKVCNHCSFSILGLKLLELGPPLLYIVPGSSIHIVGVVSANLFRLGEYKSSALVVLFGLGGYFAIFALLSWLWGAGVLLLGLVSFYSMATAIFLNAVYGSTFEKSVEIGAEVHGSGRYYLGTIALLVLSLVSWVVWLFASGELEFSPGFLEAFGL